MSVAATGNGRPSNNTMNPLIILVIGSLLIGGAVTDHPTIATPRHAVAVELGERIPVVGRLIGTESAEREVERIRERSLVDRNTTVPWTKPKTSTQLRWEERWEYVEGYFDRINSDEALVEAFREGDTYSDEVIAFVLAKDEIVFERQMEIRNGYLHTVSGRDPTLTILIEPNLAESLWHEFQGVTERSTYSQENRDFAASMLRHWRANRIRVSPLSRAVKMIVGFRNFAEGS